MDILRPPLEQQVSPVPWLLIRSNVDVPSLIGKALTARPNATVDDVVKQLSAWGAQASGIIVFMSMLKWKEQAAATRLAEGQSSAVATCIAPVMKVPARVASDRGRGGINTAVQSE